MSAHRRPHLYIKTGLAVASAVLLGLTLIAEDWIEAAFGVSPDGGDGSLEWGLVAALVAATVIFSAMARAEWGRRAAAG